MADVLELLRKKIEPHHGDAFEPESLASVRELEGLLGVSLPTGATAVLTTYGACGFAGSGSVQVSAGQHFGIFTLFDVEQIRRDRDAHMDYSEKGLVPFADDEFNNRYVWQAATNAVFFIDYSHGQGRATRVADSFEEFLGRISIEPWGDE